LRHAGSGWRGRRPISTAVQVRRAPMRPAVFPLQKRPGAFDQLISNALTPPATGCASDGNTGSCCRDGGGLGFQNITPRKNYPPAPPRALRLPTRARHAAAGGMGDQSEEDLRALQGTRPAVEELILNAEAAGDGEAARGPR
jgi:hypothetical protein